MNWEFCVVDGKEYYQLGRGYFTLQVIVSDKGLEYFAAWQIIRCGKIFQEFHANHCTILEAKQDLIRKFNEMLEEMKIDEEQNGV